MTTLAENARLAVLENQYANLQRDVSEIKDDVKAIARHQTVLATELASKTAAIATDLAVKTTAVASSLAIKTASESQHAMDRAATGTWVRSVLPWMLAAVGVALTVINLVFGH